MYLRGSTYKKRAEKSEGKREGKGKGGKGKGKEEDEKVRRGEGTEREGSAPSPTKNILPDVDILQRLNAIWAAC